jgi:hypothetical protein
VLSLRDRLVVDLETRTYCERGVVCCVGARSASPVSVGHGERAIVYSFREFVNNLYQFALGGGHQAFWAEFAAIPGVVAAGGAVFGAAQAGMHRVSDLTQWGGVGKLVPPRAPPFFQGDFDIYFVGLSRDAVLAAMYRLLQALPRSTVVAVWDNGYTVTVVRAAPYCNIQFMYQRVYAAAADVIVVYDATACMWLTDGNELYSMYDAVLGALTRTNLVVRSDVTLPRLVKYMLRGMCPVIKHAMTPQEAVYFDSVEEVRKKGEELRLSEPQLWGLTNLKEEEEVGFLAYFRGLMHGEDNVIRSFYQEQYSPLSAPSQVAVNTDVNMYSEAWLPKGALIGFAVAARAFFGARVCASVCACVCAELLRPLPVLPSLFFLAVEISRNVVVAGYLVACKEVSSRRRATLPVRVAFPRAGFAFEEDFVEFMSTPGVPPLRADVRAEYVGSAVRTMCVRAEISAAACFCAERAVL